MKFPWKSYLYKRHYKNDLGLKNFFMFFKTSLIFNIPKPYSVHKLDRKQHKNNIMNRINKKVMICLIMAQKAHKTGIKTL